MKKLLLLAIFISVFLSFQTSVFAKEAIRDGVFIHISTDDPQRLLMALNMAVLMSEDKDVLVYVDITGIKAFLKDGQDIKFGEFPSSHTQIKKLLEKGIILCVCPGCLKNAGKTEGDVMSGIKIASKEAFFNFTKGRILSLSY